MITRFRPFILSLLLVFIVRCSAPIKETVIPYTSQDWPTSIWKSEVPEGCPFEPSKSC